MYLYVGDLPGWEDSWGEIDLEANDIWRDWLFSQSPHHLGKSKHRSILLHILDSGSRKGLGGIEMKGL